MNADLILAGIDGALFDPSLVVSLRKLLVGLAVSGNLRTTAVGTVASPPAEMPLSDSLPIEPSELPAAGMTAERFARLGSIAEVKKGETGIQKAKSGRFPLVVTAQQRATTDHYDFDGPSAIVPLVSSTGHGKASLHRLHYQDGQYAVGNILAAIFPRSGSGISARFLYEYLSAFKGELLVTRMTGTANVALTIGKLKEVPVPIVSPRCQEVVDELMALCDRLEAAQAEREARRDRLVSASLARVTEPDSDDATSTTTSPRFHLDHFARLTTRPEHVKQLRQTILNLAVRGRLVPQEPKDEAAANLLNALRASHDERNQRVATGGGSPHETPPSWVWACLEDLVVFGPQNGISPKPTESQSAPKAITLTATTSGRFDDRYFKHVDVRVPETSEYWLRDGDLLFQRGNTREYVGIAAVYAGPPQTFLYPDLMMKVRLSPLIDLRFAHLAVTAPPARAYFGAKATGAQASMPKINQTILVSLPVPLPPLAEQRRIVAKVDELMALCDQLEASLASAATDRARLLEALLHEALAPAA